MKTGDDQARSSLSDKQSPSPCPSISPQRLTSMHLPELICWKLSKEYSQTPGGHVRIFRHSQLKKLGKDFGLEYLSFHWAHGLHSPYWWLQCLFWNTKDQSLIIKQYHKLLVWDLMQRPIFTRILEMILQPLIGKSLVMYFKKPLDE